MFFIHAILFLMLFNWNIDLCDFIYIGYIISFIHAQEIYIKACILYAIIIVQTLPESRRLFFPGNIITYCAKLAKIFGQDFLCVCTRYCRSLWPIFYGLQFCSVCETLL